MDAYTIAENVLSRLKTPPHRLLEIGAGGGSFLRRMVEKYHAVGVGVDPYVTEQQMENLALRRLPAEGIASLRQWFDLVFSVRAFHHFSDPVRCLKAMPSVIGWGGRCLLVDWVAGARTGYAERYYSLEQACDLITKAGLLILTKDRSGDIFWVTATLPFWKIGVAVNEGEKIIFPGMLGQAPKFAVYSFAADKGIELLEIRHNPYEKTLQPQKTFEVYKLIHDCQAVLSARIGKRGIPRLRDLGVKLFFARGLVQEFFQNAVLG
mgnify:CR=1 FL=1